MEKQPALIKEVVGKPGDVVPTTEWTDVTALCRDIASKLSDASPIAHVPGFNMFDAMSATELMDEKMDSCFNISGPLNVEEIIRDAMPSELTPTLVLATMERLFMCEMAYLNGASMVETFKLCIFMWPKVWPKLQESYGELGQLLLAFVKSLSKNTETFHKMVLGADIYEEDDFHPGSQAVQADLADADTELKTALEGLSLGAGGKEGKQAAGRNETDNQAYEKMCSLMQLREHMLRFNNSLYASVDQALEISQKTIPTNEVEQVEYEKVRASKHKNILSACVNVHASSKRFSSELHAVKQFYATADVSFDLMSATLVDDTDNIFQPKIAKLVSNNPARTIVAPSMLTCIASLEEICAQAALIARTVPGFCASGTVYDSVLAWCCSLSKSKYHVATRSLQWCLVHTLCALGGIELLLLESMKASWLPEAFTSFQLCSDWISSFGKVAWDSLKVMCMFRYRCLMRLDGNIMSWNKVSEDAPRVDQTVLSHIYPEGLAPPATSDIFWSTKWVMRIMSVLMENHLMLYAELDLLSGFELDSYFWFLEYVTSTRIWAIRKLREMRFYYDKATYDFQLAEATKLVRTHKRNKSAKINGNLLKDAKKVMDTVQPPVFPAPADEQLALAANLLFKGIDRVLISLKRIGYIRAAPGGDNSSSSDSDLSFFSAEVRFNSRYSLYRSLSHLSPVSLLDFDRAVAGIDAAEATVPEKLESAVAFFANAKAGLDVLRKNLASIPKLETSTKKEIDDFSVFSYTAETDISEKCLGLTKGGIMLNVFMMRLQQALKADEGKSQLGNENVSSSKNYKKLGPIAFSRDGIPLLSLTPVTTPSPAGSGDTAVKANTGKASA